MTDEPRKPLLSSNTYDILKMVTQIWLPAAATLYFGLSEIWGFPYGEQVIGTIAIITLFLGVLLSYSKSYYEKSGARYDGNLVVDTSNPVKDSYTFDFTKPLEDIEGKKEITLKVENKPYPPLTR